LTAENQTESERCVFLIALREIRPDEELTIDYNWPAQQAIVCRCGAPTCRGWIVDPCELSEVQEDVQGGSR
jgi:SET domain-containing protein